MVTAAPVEATTSYLAAAVWFPTHVGPPDRVATWGQRTLEVLAGQARDAVPGVIMRESLALDRQPSGWPDWDGSGRPGPRGDRGGAAAGLRVRIAVHGAAGGDAGVPALAGRAGTRSGGEISLRRVSSLGELSDGWADVLVNCTGLGARDLLGDLSVYPVRGQIVRVTNPGLPLSVRDEFHPACRAYVHPRTSDCILGGTLEEHAADRG